MENRAFYPEKMQPPLGLYAHGVEVPEDAKLTFVAGQVGMDFDGNVPDDFEGQARNAWNNCLAVLEHNRLRVAQVGAERTLHVFLGCRSGRRRHQTKQPVAGRSPR